MKLSHAQLKQIIKEELQQALANNMKAIQSSPEEYQPHMRANKIYVFNKRQDQVFKQMVLDKIGYQDYEIVSNVPTLTNKQLITLGFSIDPSALNVAFFKTKDGYFKVQLTQAIVDEIKKYK